MTPLIVAPPLAPPPTVATTVVVETPASATGSTEATLTITDPDVVEFEPDFEPGIDYDSWAPGLTRAPREAFADSLDDLDLDD